MNALAPIAELPALVKKAADRLASATSAAEVLDARDLASVVYDAAKKAGRLARAKAAHDEIIVKAAHAQADALEIEAKAKRRLAQEYDAAQERGDIRAANQGRSASALEAPTADDLGLSHKEVHDARQIDRAERADPGIVRRVLDEALAAGEEPTRAALARAIAPQPTPVEPPRPPVPDDALWLWGRIKDFERQGYFTKNPRTLLDGMTAPMRADVCAILPGLVAFLTKLEGECK